jgi:hypothetical protein
MTKPVGVLDVIAWGCLEEQCGRPIKVLLCALRPKLCRAWVVTRQELLPIGLRCWSWILVLPLDEPALHSVRDLLVMAFVKLPPSPGLLLLIVPDDLSGFSAS